jgi:DNA-binding transcriptional ArsR family regulator
VLERLLNSLPVNDRGRASVSRPAVSQHLRVLREAELVEQRRGTSHLPPEPRLTALRTYLDAFWTAALEQFVEAAERNERSET